MIEKDEFSIFLIFYLILISNLSNQLSKFFEPILTKLTPLNTTSNMANINLSIYMTKFLTAPFKHIEMYVKILKEIHRYSEVIHKILIF